MTDKRIKEEFEKWLEGTTTQEEADFANSFHHDYLDLAQGYLAGFRAAERLAKIEVLEDMLRMMDKLRFFSICDYMEAKSRIEAMISELKEASR